MLIDSAFEANWYQCLVSFCYPCVWVLFRLFLWHYYLSNFFKAFNRLSSHFVGTDTSFLLNLFLFTTLPFIIATDLDFLCLNFIVAHWVCFSSSNNSHLPPVIVDVFTVRSSIYGLIVCVCGGRVYLVPVKDDGSLHFFQMFFTIRFMARIAWQK